MPTRTHPLEVRWRPVTIDSIKITRCSHQDDALCLAAVISLRIQRSPELSTRYGATLTTRGLNTFTVCCLAVSQTSYRTSRGCCRDMQNIAITTRNIYNDDDDDDLLSAHIFYTDNRFITSNKFHTIIVKSCKDRSCWQRWKVSTKDIYQTHLQNFPKTFYLVSIRRLTFELFVGFLTLINIFF